MSTARHTAVHSQASPVRLFFDQTPQEYFLVMAEVLSPEAPGLPGDFSVHTFDHEDRFLERVGAADLSLQDLALVAATVIRSVDRMTQTLNWVELNLTQEQIAVLGLKPGGPGNSVIPTRRELDPLQRSDLFEVTENSGQFYQFLTQSPTPFAMLSGPEHQFTFINQAYVDLLGQSTQRDILMKTVREALPELEDQSFFGWLDKVYQTGVQHVGKEQMARMRRQHGLGFEDRYFDFIYYPVRNATGHVYGVMVQAADVTEKVHIQAMGEERETQIFRQWAELEAIYRTAPIGMALLEATTLRLLRLNEKHAELMDAPAEELIGKKGLDLKSLPPALSILFKRVQAGETVHNAIVEKTRDPKTSSRSRAWLVNISPFLGASGEILAYTSIALEIPD